MAGKKLFRKLDCSQAYHCLRMGDQLSSVKLAAFNFPSKKFAYRSLTQRLSRTLWAFSSFMRESLDRVIKADQCAQNVDDIGIAANDADHLIKNVKTTFECIRDPGIKITIYKCYFCHNWNWLFGRSITPEVVKPQKEQKTTSLEHTKVLKSTKVLHRYFCFHNCYQNYIPRLTEKFVPFFKFSKKTRIYWWHWSWYNN